MRNDTFGDWCKSFEQTKDYIESHKPLVIRLDGNSFHSYTKGMEKPFDSDLINAMQQTTAALVEKLNATIGYFQSDEITLICDVKERENFLFGGKNISYYQSFHH